MSTKISKNFTLEEMFNSSFADRNGLDNTTDDLVVRTNLICLVANVLQPTRSHFNEPLIIMSGYRSLAVNRGVGGSSRSQHLSGQAADIQMASVDNLTLAQFIESVLGFDQLILEFHDPKINPHSGWIHVSYNEGANRHEVLSARKVNGRTQYTPGLWCA